MYSTVQSGQEVPYATLTGFCSEMETENGGINSEQCPYVFSLLQKYMGHIVSASKTLYFKGI